MNNLTENPAITKIIFFDSHCLLCQGFIQYLWKIDSNKILYFAPLLGETSQRLVPENYRAQLNTFIYFSDDSIFEKSNGFCKILFDLGGKYRFLSRVLKMIPCFIRDFVYNIIAQNRYKWWGTSESCLILTEDEKKRLLQ